MPRSDVFPVCRGLRSSRCVEIVVLVSEVGMRTGTATLVCVCSGVERSYMIMLPDYKFLE